MEKTLKINFDCDMVIQMPTETIIIVGQTIARIRNIHTVQLLEKISESKKFIEYGFEAINSTLDPLYPNNIEIYKMSKNPYICLFRYLLGGNPEDLNDLCILSRSLPDAIPFFQNINEKMDIWVNNRHISDSIKMENEAIVDEINPKIQKFISQSGPITLIQDLSKNVKTNYPLYSSIAYYRIPSPQNAYMGTHYFGSGYGQTPEIARFKATMEGLERFTSGSLNITKLQKIPTEHLLKDRKIFTFLGIDQEEYFKGECFCKPPDSEIYPTVSSRLFKKNGKVEEWNVPYDLAFYPVLPNERKRFCIANSSGVAIHESWEYAVENALAEYAERHYLMKYWCSGRGITQCNRDSLPIELQMKMDQLELISGGAKISMLVHNGPVFSSVYTCFIKNTWPCFHIGSSSNRNLLKAAEKSLDELANAMLFCDTFWQKIQINNVYDTIDHYCYYHSPKFGKVAKNWAMSGECESWHNFQTKFAGGFQEMMQAALLEFGDIAIIDLTSDELKNKGLICIRILTENGLPAWFGNAGIPTAKKIWKEEGLEEKNWIHPLG